MNKVVKIMSSNMTIDEKIEELLSEEFLDDGKLERLATDFIENIVPIWEAYHPDDRRARDAVELRRRWIKGEITDKEFYKRVNESLVIKNDAKTLADETVVRAIVTSVSKCCSYLAARYAAFRSSMAADRASQWNESYKNEREWQLSRILQEINR